MKKMDLYKANVIKACEVVDSGKPVSLFRVFGDGEGPETGICDEADLPQGREETQEERLQAEAQRQLSRIGEESYGKGFTEGVQSQKQELLSAIDAIAAMTRMVPLIKKEILSKSEEHIVKLAIAIAEKILNQEVATRKDVILGVLKGALKNISETDGMKIRINPHDFHYMMETKNDLLESFDGVRNLVFEEDVSIKRGGAVVETMFGEVDARLENQLAEIKTAMLQL
jgi:flagellar assembly protein FliH